jgi:acyl carrier protein
VTEQAQAMAEYIQTKILRNAKVQILENTPLVSSGLVDSLALVDVISKLEEVTKMRIPIGKVGPSDLDTIEQMLATAKRVGRPLVGQP